MAFGGVPMCRNGVENAPQIFLANVVYIHKQARVIPSKLSYRPLCTEEHRIQPWDR